MYFPHGLFSWFQYDLVGVMDDPVAYGVCKSGVSYDVVPGVNRELACYDGGASPVPVLHDLKDVSSFSVRKGVYSPVVNDEEPHSLYPLEELPIAPVRPRDSRFLDKPGQPHIKGSYSLPHRAIC